VQDAVDALREAGLYRFLKPTEVIRVHVLPYSRRVTPTRTCSTRKRSPKDVL
jgi:hypothetical protein